MEFKSLIIGLFMSLAAFAIKSGGGLAYLLLQTDDNRLKVSRTLIFVTGYALVFMLAAGVVTTINLTAHIDGLQAFFKSGMTLHFIMALLLVLWGIKLLSEKSAQRTTRGWIPLVVPCPVCFTAILLSSGFVATFYPGSLWVFIGLFAGYILISLAVAFGFFLLVRIRNRKGSAEPFLGTLMLYLAGYFLLSVIIIPQFADLDKIYRLSLSDSVFEWSKQNLFVLAIALTGLAAGFTIPSKRE